MITGDIPTCERKCSEIKIAGGSIEPPENEKQGWLYVSVSRVVCGAVRRECGGVTPLLALDYFKSHFPLRLNTCGYNISLGGMDGEFATSTNLD